MNNKLFLENYQQLQYTIMYNKLIDLDFASVALGNIYESPFFNHALTHKILNKAELDEIERLLISEKRKPAVYFENKPEQKEFVNFLEDNGYKKLWEDSWMFHTGKDLADFDSTNIKKVCTQTNLEIFLHTFNECYKKGDPQNPYGELGNYIDVAREPWLRHNETDRIEYFIVFDGNEPVAVSTLTNFAGLGYISNVGSLKTVRGKGFGKQASLYCVQKSLENGNSLHFLATEEGQYPNEFYKRIGFETRLTATGFVKD